MKILILSFFFFLVGCTSYHIDNCIYSHLPNTLNSNLKKSHFSTTKLNKINRKVIKALNDYGININSGKYNSENYLNLVLYGKAYGSEHGYFILSYLENNITKTACILYLIKDKSVSFSFYYIPINCNNWECVKPYLVVDNMRLFKGN